MPFDMVESGFELAGGFLILEILYILFVGAIGIAAYVAQSLSFYSIARRRGIKNPWLSWVPVGCLWILGSISDQYQYVVKRQVKNKRKTMLVLSIVTLALDVLVVAGVIGMIVGLGAGIAGVAPGMEEYVDAGFIGSVLMVVVGSLAMSGTAIALAVVEYIALYDLYTSCEPNNAVVYLLLSIFVSIAMPVVLLLCRGKDLGMPPRKPAPPPVLQEPAAWVPTDPTPWKDEE